MEGYLPEVMARMPLAEAVLTIWRWIADEKHLESLFERHRGRAYQRVLSFPLLVQLIADAIIQHGGSGRRSFERAKQAGTLAVSVQAAYGKLRRLPLPLSMGFLAECTDRLRDLFPEAAAHPLPPSLDNFQVVVLDGKAIKRVAKRLKPLRGVSGGVLGGRALVAMSLKSGLAVAMHAHPDGDANDVRFVPDLLPVVRQRVPGPRLWLGDRAFCNLEQVVRFNNHGDHFLVRRRTNVRFEPDAARSTQTGRDADDRGFVETWGWLGNPRDPRRLYVRQIALERPGEETIFLITDLLDAQRYPASDLLQLYMSRWGIERMFQQVTEVFGLQALIGGTPEATVFQFAFCLVLYNIIQVLRGYIATARKHPPETISSEKLFYDVERELTAWSVLVSPAETIAYLTRHRSRQEVRRQLHKLLDSLWTSRWLRAPPQRRRSHPPPRASARTHSSVYRILQAQREQPRQRRRRAR